MGFLAVPPSSEASYQAEVARRAKMTPEELAAEDRARGRTPPLLQALSPFDMPRRRRLISPGGIEFDGNPGWLSPMPKTHEVSHSQSTMAAAGSVVLATTPEIVKGPAKPRTRRRSATLAITDRRAAIASSRNLIALFQEAAEYDPALHHNQGKPLLWINDERYLLDIREIVGELRKIVTLLEAQAKPLKAAPVRKTARRFGKLIDAYQSTLGHSLAVLTVMGVASWAVHLGLVPAEFSEIAKLRASQTQ